MQGCNTLSTVSKYSNMIQYIKYAFTAAVVLALGNACNKVDDLPFYAGGTTTTLTSSSTAVAPAVADSSNAVVSFSWSDPAYAGVDSSTEKYVVELDSSGRNFMKAVQYTVTGSRNFSLTGNQLNNQLIAWGFPLNAATNVDVRVISSLPNNNQQLFSNTLTIAMTPYAVPFSLSASAAGPLEITIINKQNTIETFNWQIPSYQNATYTYELQYDSTGKNFANPKVVATGITDTTTSVLAGDLNTYASASGVAYGTQGSLDFRIMATVNGKQQIASSIQTVQVIPNDIAVSLLYVPGDYQGWSPSSAPPLASTDGLSFDGYVNMTSTNGFKLTSAPDWNHTNYGDGGGSGKLSADGSAGNLTVPAQGYYRLQANTGALTWSATLTNWGIIGAAGNGWDDGKDVALTFDATTNTWVINSISLKADKFKFRANGKWDINLGGEPSKLTYGGADILVSEAGNYKVVLDLTNPAAYKYTLTKL